MKEQEFFKAVGKLAAGQPFAKVAREYRVLNRSRKWETSTQLRDCSRVCVDCRAVPAPSGEMTGKVQETTLAALEQMALAKMQPVRELPEVIREIEARDLPLLAQEQRERNWATASPDKTIATLRMGHQQLAQLLASGTNEIDASMMTGRSVASIKSLLTDPAFKELMAYSKEQTGEQKFDAYGRLVTLGGTAMDVLQERLEETPDKFTNNELRQIVESTMDRSAAPAKGDPRQGAGQSGGLNVQINFVPARNGQVIEGEVASGKLIEHEEAK